MNGRLPALALLLDVLLQASLARAETITLSALPLSSDDIPKAPGKERMADVRNDDTGFITALDQPVCIDGGGASPHGCEGYIPSDSIRIDRLTVTEPPLMDRLVIDTNSQLPVAKVLRRARLPLRRVVDGPLSVYAYRTKTEVVVLIPQGFASARDAFAAERQMCFERRGCGFETIQIPLKGGFGSALVRPPQPMDDAGRWVTLNEFLEPASPPISAPASPPESSPWFVNASLSKVTRDPEPILSVVVRKPQVDPPKMN